jgi:hypothetical protein
MIDLPDHDSLTALLASLPPDTDVVGLCMFAPLTGDMAGLVQCERCKYIHVAPPSGSLHRACRPGVVTCEYFLLAPGIVRCRWCLHTRKESRDPRVMPWRKCGNPRHVAPRGCCRSGNCGVPRR